MGEELILQSIVLLSIIFARQYLIHIQMTINLSISLLLHKVLILQIETELFVIRIKKLITFTAH